MGIDELCELCAELHLMSFAHQLKPGEYVDLRIELFCKSASEQKVGLVHQDLSVTLDELYAEIYRINHCRWNNTFITTCGDNLDKTNFRMIRREHGTSR